MSGTNECGVFEAEQTPWGGKASVPEVAQKLQGLGESEQNAVGCRLLTFDMQTTEGPCCCELGSHAVFPQPRFGIVVIVYERRMTPRAKTDLDLVY